MRPAMQLPFEEASQALRLDDWLQGSSIPLAVAAHPSGLVLALARGHALVVAPLQQAQHAASSQTQLLQQQDIHQQLLEQHEAVVACRIHYSEQQLTAVAWFAHLKRSSDVDAGFAIPQQQDIQPAVQHQQLVQSLLESELLLSGTADGHLQMHTPAGQLLFRQRLMTSAVLDIIVRPHCSGLRSTDASEEVCVTFSNALVRINTLELRSLIRMLQMAQQGNHSAAATIQPLTHIRYEFPAAVGPRVSGVSFGPVLADLYSLLSSGANSSTSSRDSSRQLARHKVCVITVGKSPCVAAFEAEERPSKSTLSMLVGMASSLTSGVAGAASKAAGLGPSLMYQGVKSLMKPWSSWSNPYISDSSSAYAVPASQPVASYDDAQQLAKPEALSLSRQLRDDDRVLEGLVPAPVGALLVAPDNLGRVMLLEGASMTAVRLWKGYRDAQCGWILPPPGHPCSHLGLLLVLLAPKRQTLEVWMPRSGQRLASTAVDYPCLLVPVGLPCGGWGNDKAMNWWRESGRSATTLVVNLQTGEIWDAFDCLIEE